MMIGEMKCSMDWSKALDLIEGYGGRRMGAAMAKVISRAKKIHSTMELLIHTISN